MAQERYSDSDLMLLRGYVAASRSVTTHFPQLKDLLDGKRLYVQDIIEKEEELREIDRAAVAPPDAQNQNPAL